MTDREFKQKCILAILNNPQIVKMYFNEEYGEHDDLIQAFPAWVNKSAENVYKVARY